MSQGTTNSIGLMERQRSSDGQVPCLQYPGSTDHQLRLEARREYALVAATRNGQQEAHTTAANNDSSLWLCHGSILLAAPPLLSLERPQMSLNSPFTFFSFLHNLEGKSSSTRGVYTNAARAMSYMPVER
jgi:hypothetical protein